MISVHPSRGILLSLCLLPIGCAVGPTYKGPPPVANSADWAGSDRSGVAVTQAPDALWWRALGDPLLDDLVDTAVRRNLDLRVAVARLDEARAYRATATSGNYPQVSLDAAASENQLSTQGELPIDRIPGFGRRFGLLDVGFDASWELDFWGRNARAVEAADARMQAAAEEHAAARLQVVAEVVRTYVDLRSAQSQLESVRQQVDARRRIAELVAQRTNAGEDAHGDAARAAAQADAAQAALPGLASTARAAAYSLAVLTGQPPEALSGLADRPGALPAAPGEVGIGLRSELLRRRPDIRDAERQLAAATADIGVATADLFPRITLIAGVGQQAQHPGDLLSGMSTRYQVGPSFSWPIFSAGRIRAQIRAADARADAAAAHYESAVLGAFADSETALNRYAAAGVTAASQDGARVQSCTARDLGRQRFAAGEDDLLTALELESACQTAVQTAIVARAAQLTAYAALFKALGGGWQP